MKRMFNVKNSGINLAIRSDVSRPLIVCSHERSGTHFLMNSIAHVTSFTVNPYLNFDHNPLGSYVNFYSKDSITNFINYIKDVKINSESYCVASIIKSHHRASILENAIKNNAIVAYVFRNPADVLISYWRFLHRYNWLSCEVAFPSSPFQLAILKPNGEALNFQTQSHDTFFDRWATHLSDWICLAEQYKENIFITSYSQLMFSHNKTVSDICTKFKLEMTHLPKIPSRHKNVVLGSNIEYSDVEYDKLISYCKLRLQDYPNLAKIFMDTSEHEFYFKNGIYIENYNINVL